MLKKVLLVSGLLSSVLYLATDTIAEVRYPDYHSYLTQAISELGAIGAPTRPLVEPLFIAYDLLLLAFSVGVWVSGDDKRTLRVIAALLAGIAVTGWLTPAMHLRGTSDLAGDMPHIIGTSVIVLLILTAVGLGAALFGSLFRAYSLAILVTLLVAGISTYAMAGQLAAGEPTPWLGAVERINIGAFLLWVAALAVMLLRREVPATLVSHKRPRIRSFAALRMR
jgi:uncharacterized protein DUF998